METLERGAEGEIERLQGRIRSRKSVEHLAKAWSVSLVCLLLCGVWAKLCKDSLGHPLFLWPGALLCLSLGLFVCQEVRRGLAELGEERSTLRRLRELQALAGPAKELF